MLSRMNNNNKKKLHLCCVVCSRQSIYIIAYISVQVAAMAAGRLANRDRKKKKERRDDEKSALCALIVWRSCSGQILEHDPLMTSDVIRTRGKCQK